MIIQHEKINTWEVFVYSTAVFHSFKQQPQYNYDLKLKGIMFYQRRATAVLSDTCFSFPPGGKCNTKFSD